MRIAELVGLAQTHQLSMWAGGAGIVKQEVVYNRGWCAPANTITEVSNENKFPMFSGGCGDAGGAHSSRCVRRRCAAESVTQGDHADGSAVATTTTTISKAVAISVTLSKAGGDVTCALSQAVSIAFTFAQTDDHRYAGRHPADTAYP